jgi:S-methylmethionine-dependent homocysteine/selenocysteine methylase
MGAEYNGGGRAGFAARLADAAPLVLDGATGTELERRGIESSLPLWSAHALLVAPEAVARIHADYVAAGAELITANTFRTQQRSLARGGAGERAAELTRLAVELARGAAAGAGRPVLVAGSAPPLEDCYRPDLVPPDAALEREHAQHAEHLARAGVDGILLETMNSVREAAAAARAAACTGLPFAASFVSWRDARLISGEPLAEALEAVARFAPVAVGVNCLPPSAVAGCLAALRASGLPFGIQPNLGAPADEQGLARSEETSPEELARAARAWLAAGARFLGGCCGTTPAHIRALAGLCTAMRGR